MDRKYLHLCMHVQARGQCLWSSSLTMHLVFGESLSLTLKLISLSKLESHWDPGVLCLLSLSSPSFPVPFALPSPPLCLPSHLHPPSRVIDTHSSAYLGTREWTSILMLARQALSHRAISRAVSWFPVPVQLLFCRASFFFHWCRGAVVVKRESWESDSSLSWKSGTLSVSVSPNKPEKKLQIWDLNREFIFRIMEK